MVNKLDIINLKNQTEKIKISLPNISPRTLDRIKSLEILPEGKKGSDRFKTMEKEIGAIKCQLKAKNQKDLTDIAAGMEFINQRLDKFETNFKDIKKKLHTQHEKSHKNHEKHKEHAHTIKHLRQKLGKIEKKTSSIKHCKKCGAVISGHAKFCNKCGRKVQA
jgi:ribosomal protein L40E